MKKKTPAIPSHVVVDTRTGEVVDTRGANKKTDSELLIIIVSQTIIVSWPFAIWSVLSRIGINELLIGVLCVISLILAFKAFLHLQEMRKQSEYAEYDSRQAEFWQKKYIEIAKEYERLQKSIDETGGR
jgi:hypothetical protein